MHDILPWHEQAWQYFLTRKNIGKLPHAILIKGISGVGKLSLAKNLAALFLCTDGADTACGKCNSCTLLQADNHPDLVMIQPDEPGKAIKIDQIREVIADLNNTSHQGGMKVVIIDAAELLNVAAANALLKTLEEPAPHTVIILISAHPMMLSATIRSRCQILSIHTPKYFVAQKWLKQQIPDVDVTLLLALAENAPLKALGFAKDGMLQKRQEFFTALEDLQHEKIGVLQMVDNCLDWGIDDLLTTLVYIISDLIKIKLGAMSQLVNRDQIDRLNIFAAKVNISRLFTYKDHLYRIRRHFFDRINLNQQMVVENLIVSWIHL